MSLAGTAALTELWAKTKAWFGNKLSASTTATTVSVSLKNNAEDVLATATIASASSTAAGAMSADDKSKLDDIAPGATANTGTVTSVSAGVGLSGGSITDAGTIKAKLRSETSLTADSVAATETANRIYPVVPDKSGYLAVNVPWTDSPSTDVNVTNTLNTTAKAYITGTTSATTSTGTQVFDTGVYLDTAAGSLVAATFSGNGAALTSLNASNLGSGTVPEARLGTVSVAKGGTGGTDAATARTNLSVYSKTEVDSMMTGAAQFQGTVADNATISGSNYKKGWYWVVSKAGTYVGQSCEVGDMVFCVKDKASAYSASDFSVVQNNVVEMTAAEVDAICV